jgi:EmrB/QacA subfamily drug resistance transporter
MGSALNVALPVIGQEFHPDAVLLSWVVTSFILAMAVFSVPSGRLADISGIKNIFTWGMVLLTLSTAAIAFSNSVILLITFRAVQGASSAMLAGTSVAMIIAIFPAKDRGRGLGASIACVYFGQSIGPFLGGILTEHLGWRSIFLVSLPFCLLIMAVLFWKVRGEWAECKGEKFDYPGSVIYGLALVALMYGFSALPQFTGAVLTGIGIVGILVFLRWESRAKSPLLAVNAFRSNRLFIFANLASLISFIATAGLVFLLSLYLQYIKGLSPEQAGLILVAQPVLQAILSPISGKLSDKTSPRLLSAAGMTLIFIGLLALCFMQNETPIALIVVILIVIGTGIGLFSSPNVNSVMGSVTPKYYGVASSMIGTIRTIGQTLSMGIATIIIAVMIGRAVLTPELYPAFLTSFKIIFGIFSAFCFTGIFASLVKGKPAKTQ